MMLENKSDNLICPVCASAQASFHARKKNHEMFRCSKCGLIFVWPVKEDFKQIYSQGYFSGVGCGLGYADYEGDKDSITETFKIYLDKIENILPEKGKLYDVGAATGHFVGLANGRGWKASGIDVSQYAVNAGKRNGLDLEQGDFQTISGGENIFDLVTCWDVLEHFSDPKAAIRQAKKILKTGGIIAINTPDSASVPARVMGGFWHLLDPPNHLCIFNRKNLELLLRQNGFEILHESRIGKKFSVRYILKVLANWKPNIVFSKISGRAGSARWGRLNIPLNTRDNMFLIARKKDG